MEAWEACFGCRKDPKSTHSPVLSLQSIYYEPISCVSSCYSIVLYVIMCLFEFRDVFVFFVFVKLVVKVVHVLSLSVLNLFFDLC